MRLTDWGISAEVDQILKQLAKPVQTLVVRRLAPAGGEISIGGDSPFILSKRLTDLLLFAASGPPGEDGIVGFRLVSDAMKALNMKRHTLNNLIHRLRLTLTARDWRLLETVDGNQSIPARFRFRTRALIVVSP